MCDKIGEKTNLSTVHLQDSSPTGWQRRLEERELELELENFILQGL